MRFPDPQKMVADLNSKGLGVSLWTHPFLSLKSQSFKHAVENKFAVMSRVGVHSDMLHNSNKQPVKKESDRGGCPL